MRLSTERDRDEARGVEVIHAALDAGVMFFDTADAYGWDDHETGHNERLIARAFATWKGDRAKLIVATKGGLTRPGGRWVANGRASHLRAACEASRRALGVDRVALYQLHAPDPRTPLSTSVRALASLQRDGLADHIGLCNVTVGQIEEARRIVDIAAVQVELSAWNDANVLGGVVDYCLANDIRVIAHRPLGGPQRARRARNDRALAEVASHHDASAQEIALAWLMDLSAGITPIPGATRVETARSIARARAIQLTERDRAILLERFAVGRQLSGRKSLGKSTRPRAASADTKHGEIAMIMGLPGAGKTTLAQTLVAQGYARLNRDEEGGSLDDLLPALTRLVESGRSRVVLDNTYVSRKSRAPVVEWAAAAGLPVRCLWLSTSVEDAQVNACWRLLSTYGRLLGPEEMRKASRKDVNVFSPVVQFRYQRELEPPDVAEGFSRIDIVPFERARNPALTNRAVIVWCDNVLVRSRSDQRAPLMADDVEAIEGRAQVLRRYQTEGWQILGLAWRPEVSAERVTSQEVDVGLARMRELLGVDIDVQYCPHGAGPPVCWCRKPLPGLGVAFIREYRLDPSQCIYVGAGAQDPGFARRLGFQYRDAADFFRSLPPAGQPSQEPKVRHE
jgi:aryl-alcohol dehydrogenase-like predicted oxidoreductase/histidinol phosphatase-like enzyme